MEKFLMDYFCRLMSIIGVVSIFNYSAHAAEEMHNLQQQNVHQQEQQKALQSQLSTTGKDVRSQQQKTQSNALVFIDVPACQKIKKITINKDDAVPHWLPLQRLADNSQGHCMNANNIKKTVITLQNYLIDSGFITSRIAIPEQNVASGSLILSVVSGKISAITLSSNSSQYTNITNAFPGKSGGILNLRDLEQALENIQNIPSTEAHFNLVPANEQGESEIQVERIQTSYWRAAGWMDDSGSKYTGRYQAGAALYLDNPTSFNDLFYISAGHDLQNSDHLGNKNRSLNYSIPWGYWSLNVYASENEYHQRLVQRYSDYQYRGKNRYLSAKLSRVIHRGAMQKTTFSSQVIKRDSHFYISDTELELQKLNLTNLRFDLAHRHYVGSAVIDADVSWQRNTHWFGSQKTASADFGLASDISNIFTLDLQALVPFQLAGFNMSYQPHYYQQYSPSTLITQDQFSIGNRWTIRGFNGENTLMGDRGWYLSNTINLDLPALWNNQLYLGADVGQVSHSTQDWISGRTMAGGTIGIRGMHWRTGYDIFAGTPLYKPHGLATDGLTLGFTLQWMY